jgi:hypothetical protein
MCVPRGRRKKKGENPQIPSHHLFHNNNNRIEMATYNFESLPPESPRSQYAEEVMLLKSMFEQVTCLFFSLIFQECNIMFHLDLLGHIFFLYSGMMLL